MGILYKGIKYIQLYNDHALKTLFLEDNVYFTVRDIFLNAHDCDHIIEANEHNTSLSNNIRFEERDDTFNYSDDLQKRSFIKSLSKWFSQLDYEEEYDFDDEVFDEDTKVLSSDHPFLRLHTKNEKNDYNHDYIKFEVWREHMRELNWLLDARYREL